MDFIQAIADEHVYLFDGAMGTMLYSKGVFINKCYDELNLSNLKPAQPRTFPAARFGDASTLKVGDRVLALGSPLALSQSVTMGIVSNTEMIMPGLFWPFNRMTLDGEDVGSIVRWIGHDAAIFGGNSARLYGIAVRSALGPIENDRIVAIANEPNVSSPVRNMPAMAIITVRPETSTAWPDVAAANSSASSLERPASRSSILRRR